MVITKNRDWSNMCDKFIVISSLMIIYMTLKNRVFFSSLLFPNLYYQSKPQQDLEMSAEPLITFEEPLKAKIYC